VRHIELRCRKCRDFFSVPIEHTCLVVPPPPAQGTGLIEPKTPAAGDELEFKFVSAAFTPAERLTTEQEATRAECRALLDNARVVSERKDTEIAALKDTLGRRTRHLDAAVADAERFGGQVCHLRAALLAAADALDKTGWCDDGQEWYRIFGRKAEAACAAARKAAEEGA
jgi:hypothetical protein